MMKSRRKGLTRRAVAALATMPLLIWRQEVAWGLRGRNTAAASTLLQSPTLVNNGGSTMTAGTISPMILLAFKKGDIPSGTWFSLKVSGVVQPHSYGMDTYWRDGSLRCVSIFCRTTFLLAANATQAIGVWSGGTKPSASSRTLTELHNQLIRVNLIAAPVSRIAFSGTMSAWLNGDSNEYEVLTYMDGAAGKVYRISNQIAATVGGTPQGNIVVTHYALLKTDASGSLGGIAYLPCARQPWYNKPGATQNWQLLTPGSNWQYGSGPIATDITWQRNSGQPFAPQTFAVTGGQAATTSSNNWWFGGTFGGNQLPCYVTTTGTLPRGLSPNTVYFVNSDQENGATNNVAFYEFAAGQAGPIKLTSSGMGTHTITPCPLQNPFGKLFFATADARWNEFTGTGTGNTGTSKSLQWQMDRNYLHSTKLIPPWDLSFVGGVTDLTYSFDWNPVSICNFALATDTTGEQGSLGFCPTGHAIHFFTQSKLADKFCRISGFAGALFGFDFRDYTTGNLPNMVNATYSGMPAYQTSPTILQYGGGSNQWFGFTIPSNGGGATEFSTNSTEHQVCASYYPYILTGEPQFYDILLEIGDGVVLQPLYGADCRNPKSGPGPAYGLVTVFNETRTLAWANRAVQQAAVICAATPPDGSAIHQYFQDLAAANAKWPNDVLNPTYNCYGTSTTFITTSCLWAPVRVDTSNAVWEMQGWEIGYFIGPMVYAASAREDANALAFCQKMSTRFNYILNNFGGVHLYGYNDFTHTGDYLFSSGWPPISDAAHWGTEIDQVWGGAVGINWINTGSPAFSWTGIAGNSAGYVPANGDKIIIGLNSEGNTKPNELSTNTPYYLINVSGKKFDLATSRGGSSISIATASGTINPMNLVFLVMANPPTSKTDYVFAFGPPTPDGYCPNIQGACSWMKAAGVTGLDPIINDGLGRQAAAGTSFALNPKYKMQSSF